MKKLLIALTFASAGALANAGDVTKGDNTQWNENWFVGISSPTEIGNLGNVNSTWAGLTSDNASVESSKLVLDLDTDEVVTNTLGTATLPVDTNTCNVIKFNALMTPIAVANLPTFDSNAPKTGFALGYETSGESTVYRYHVFNGLQWISNNTTMAAAPTTASDVVITISGWCADHATATYKVGDTVLEFDTGATYDTNVTLNASLAANVSSIAIQGSGTLASLSGDIQYAVATVENHKCPTLASAVYYADNAQGLTDRSVKVLRANTENVTINNPNTVITDSDGKAQGIVTPGSEVAEIKIAASTGTKTGGGSQTIAESGEYTLNTKVSSDSDLAKVTIKLPSDNKEVASKTRTSDGYIKITTQTASNVLANAVTQISGAAAPTADGLGNNTTKGGLRYYLTQYASTAYNDANVSAESIETALNAAPDGNTNGLKLWQDCAMGITPTTSLKPIAALGGQTNEKKIMLAIPELTGVSANSDYTVVYKCGDSDITDPSAFEISNETAGEYVIKAVITPKQ